MTTTSVPNVSEPLEVVGGVARLICGRCLTCHEVIFPYRAWCQHCGHDSERSFLPSEGTLWTWTSQEFEPTSPPYRLPPGQVFEPFVVGYVEFPGDIRIEGLLTVSDPAVLRIGMAMVVVAVPRGESLVYSFAPVSSELEH